MSQYAQVNVKFGADISQFSTAMQNAARQMQRAGQQLQDVGKSMTMNLTAPIVALGAASLYAFGQIDALKRGLISFAGSAEAAETEFSKLRDVAKLPGIGLEEAVKGSINLQAIGMSADDARTAMIAFGNAIATVGGGRENFELAIRGFGQLTNASKPLQQDLYQIANQLPQVNKLMIDAFGTNRAEDLAAMGMSGKQLAEFLVAELGKLPPVAGGIKNAFENMKDSTSIALAGFGEAIEKNFDISGKLTAFADWITRISEGFKTLEPDVQKFILVTAGLLAVTGPLLLTLGGLVKLFPVMVAGYAAVKGAVLALTVTFAPMMLQIGLAVAAIASIVTIGVWAYQNWTTLKERFVKLWYDMARGLWDIIVNLTSGVNKAFQAIGIDIFEGVAESAKEMRDSVPVTKITGDLITIKEAFKRTWADIKNAITIDSPVMVTPETTDTGDGKGKGSGVKPRTFEPMPEMQTKGISTIYDQTKTEVETGWDKINEAEFLGGEQFVKTSKSNFDKYIQSFTQFVNQIDAMFESFVENTIADFAAAIGEALVNQENPFDSWGKNLLNALGGFMQQMGALFIGWGVNLALFKDSLKTMNPYLAIAAGVALVGIGAAISATARKGLEGSGSGSSSGYSTRGARGEDLTLTTRLDGRDLVLSGQRTTSIGRR